MGTDVSETARRRVLKCLVDIVTDGEQKAADRISAAKLLLDRERPERAVNEPLTVVFKDIPPEYYG